MANPFYVQPANPMQGLQGLLGGVEKMQTNQANQAKHDQQKQIMGSYFDAMESGDIGAQRELMRNNPIMAQQLQQVSSLGDVQQDKLKNEMASRVMNEGMTGQEIVEAFGPTAKSLGMDIERLAGLSQDQLKEVATQSWMGSESHKRWLETQKGKGGGDDGLPAEAVAFNDLIKEFTPNQQKTARLVKAGLKGRAMSNAELSAIESGDIKNYADWKATMKQQQKFAEMTGSSRAKAIDKGFESIVKIDAGMKNIDRAISAIESGAGVGAVEKIWPSIKAASVELDNIRGQMALDVVGATTFGALSKGELDLAKDIALPTGLDSAELKAYLVKKRAAQEKLRGYYNEQIQFLDQGGTVAGFLRQKEAGQAGGATPASQSAQPAGRFQIEVVE